MGSSKIVVYTAITGNLDNLIEPQYVSENCDYLCFTDNLKVTSKTWVVKQLPFMQADVVRRSKKPKILPHLFLEDYDISIWIDGNFKIRGNIAELAEEVLSVHNMALFRHPDNRESVYEEAEACIRLKKDKPYIIKQQVEKYRLEGLPAKSIQMNGVIFRRHNDISIINAMEHWWQEICDNSRRDQLSFAYIAWKNNLSYYVIDENGIDNKWFKKERHRLSLNEHLNKKYRKLKKSLIAKGYNVFKQSKR